MITILTFIFFGFGIIIGSFLNVVILRMNTERSFGGRSACMVCSNTLSWYELIPVVSFLGLGGRCRNCKTKISIQYPLVEITTGIIFAVLFLKFQDLFFFSTDAFALTYAYYTLLSSILIIIAVYDMRHGIIPDSLSGIFGILAFAGLFLFGSNSGDSFAGLFLHLPSIMEFLSGILIALPLYLFWLFSRGKWMGLGDAKLALGLGWFLGISRALSGLVVAFWLGAIIGICLIIFSPKHGLKSEIPFAPYLVLGAFIAFFFELHLFTGFPVGFF